MPSRANGWFLWGSLLPLLSRPSPKNYPRDLEHPWEKGCIYDGKNSINIGKICLNGGKILLILGKSDPVYINSMHLDFSSLCHKCYTLLYQEGAWCCPCSVTSVTSFLIRKEHRIFGYSAPGSWTCMWLCSNKHAKLWHNSHRTAGKLDVWTSLKALIWHIA